MPAIRMSILNEDMDAVTGTSQMSTIMSVTILLLLALKQGVTQFPWSQLCSYQRYMSVDYAALIMSHGLSEHVFLGFMATSIAMSPRLSFTAGSPPPNRRTKLATYFRHVIGLRGFNREYGEKCLKDAMPYVQLQREQGAIPTLDPHGESVLNTEIRTQLHLDLSIIAPYSYSAIMILTDIDLGPTIKEPSGFCKSADPFILLHMFIKQACKSSWILRKRVE